MKIETKPLAESTIIKVSAKPGDQVCVHYTTDDFKDHPMVRICYGKSWDRPKVQVGVKTYDVQADALVEE